MITMPTARTVGHWPLPFVVALVMTASVGVAADETVPDWSLEMSRALTWDADGTPVADETAIATPTDSATVESGSDTAPQPAMAASPRGISATLAVGLTLLGLLAGALLARRSVQDQTPAQDRLAGELARLRERYLGVLSQRDQRRDPAWDSTVSTLRADVQSARALLDNQRDQCATLQAELTTEQRNASTLGTERDDLAGAVASYKHEVAELSGMLEEALDRKQTLEDWHASAREENRGLVTRIDVLESEAANADEMAERIQELETKLDQATTAAKSAEARIAPANEKSEQAQARAAKMLDKNLALEAELARLSERLSIGDHAHAQQVASLLDERQVTEQERAQREVDLQNQLRESHAAFVKRETELNDELNSTRDDLAHADDAKRRVLSLLRQEKADAADAHSELESLRVDHAHTLEQFESVQSMLSVAEDRIDDQERQLDELQDENRQLRREIADRDTGEFRRMAANVKQATTVHGGISVQEHSADDKLLRTIEQLTRSRDAAVEELTRMQALHMPLSPSDSKDVRDARTLNEARMTIRRLESDLRLRGDLIDSLRRDIETYGSADQQLGERDSEIARLKSELAMALDETSRLRNLSDTAERTSPRDLLRLRERIDGLQERLDLKEKEIAILRSASDQEQGESPLQDHVSRLEADQEASVTVIRFLESEVEKLSRELRASESG